MAVVEMQKINIIAHNKIKEDILGFLQNKGLMEFIDIAEEAGSEDADKQRYFDQEVQEADYNLAEVAFALDFLKPYHTPKNKGLAAMVEGDIVRVSATKLESVLKEFDFGQVVKRVKDIDGELVEIKNRLHTLGEEEHILSPWKSFHFSLNAAKETSSTKMLLGKIDKRDFELLTNELRKASPLSFAEEVSQTETESYVYVIFAKEIETEVMAALEDVSFSEANFLDSDNTPSEELEVIHKESKELGKKRETLEKELHSLAKDYDELKIIYDSLVWQRDNKASRKKFRYTQETFSMQGWVPKAALPELHKELDAMKACALTELEAEEGDNIPVQIENSAMMKPFESVTGVYGLPLYSETDPTPFLSLFFIVFFGICLSDAGYGVVLFLTFLGLQRLPFDEGTKGMLKLLTLGGVFTFAAGILYGGWFGMTPDQAPEFMTVVNSEGVRLFIGQIFEPIKDPITILLLSVVLGTIQIWVGIAVDCWWKIKQGKVMDGILDSGLWLYFIAAIVFYVLTALGIVDKGLNEIALYTVYAGVAALVLTQGRAQGNIIGKLGIGTLSLYNLIGYLSDILSYSRLLALGLATGIIALAVNIVAVLMNDMIPYVGWIFMILILIGGHIFNLGLSALGSFIHSSRLQFVEFFGKFMEGGGSPFKPFRKESKYTHIK